MIHLYLGLLLFSFLTTAILVVPYINLLYRLKFQRQDQKTLDFQNKRTPIFDKFHAQKTCTPVGGGALIIFVLKFFGFEKSGFFGLRMKYKLMLQFVLGLITSIMIYLFLGIHFIYIPFIGAINLGLFSIVLHTTLIVGFANFFNFTDGLDGLSCGLLMISLFAFWFLSANQLDTPISLFLTLWIGSLIAFLYFNVYPARIWLGDVGALSFGATFAVIAIILGKIIPLGIVGSPFIIEGMSSAIQVFSKLYLHRKIFPAAPIHLTLQKMGWEEPKIVARAWLAGIVLAIFGLWLGLN